MTTRAFLIGLLLVVIINIGAPYSMYILHSSFWTISYLPLSVVFFFFLLILANILTARFSPSLALRPAELILIFAMALVGASIPTWGTASYVIAVIASPRYFVSPENQWEQYVLRYLPSWMTVNDQQALRDFFNGLHTGAKIDEIPWGAWVVPLFWWGTLVFAVFLLCHSLVAILRRQWVENERLPFALMEVPREMIRRRDERSVVPTFLTQKIFWIGFLIPFMIILWNVVGYFRPWFPAIRLSWKYISVARNFPGVMLAINFGIVGFTYFIHLDVSFSIWFFVLLTMIEEGVFNTLGYTIPGRHVYTLGHPAIGWQSFGAMAFLVLNLLWLSRSSFARVFGAMFGKQPPREIEAREIMSSRATGLCLLGSLLYVVFWLHASGMSALVIALFLFGTLVVYVGITRVVAEGGLLFVRAPMIPQTFVIYSLGSANMEPQSLISMAISYSWLHELKGFFMPASAHVAKLASDFPSRRHTISACVLIAAFVGMAVSFLYTIYVGYMRGALNFGSWIFAYGCQVPYIEAVNAMKAKAPPDMARLTFLAVGAGAMFLLTVIRYRIPWWPLHPLALPVGICSYSMNFCVFSIFLGWLAKWILLKFGGNSLYKAGRPFFLGIILGFFVGVGISFVIDVIWFPGRGHSLYGY